MRHQEEMSDTQLRDAVQVRDRILVVINQDIDAIKDLDKIAYGENKEGGKWNI